MTTRAPCTRPFFDLTVPETVDLFNFSSAPTVRIRDLEDIPPFISDTTTRIT